MENVNVTPGSRLRDLIEQRGYKMKVFAELTGVVPTTLSKFVNGKPMTDKYIQRAADILDVTPEYIKCETDDMISPRYLQYEVSDEVRSFNRQLIQFKSMESFLKSLGLDIVWKAQICESDDVFLLSGNGWVHISGDNDKYNEEGMDENELLKIPGCRINVEINFKKKKIIMEDQEFKRWMKYLVSSVELCVQEKFDVFYDISMKLEETADKKNGF